MSVLSLRALQELAEAKFSIEQTRQDLNRIAEWFYQRDYCEHAIDIAFCQERKLPKSIAKEAGVFFVDEDESVLDFPEEFKAESLGFIRKNHFVFKGRLMYPVYDVKHNIMGFCGWDKFVDGTKYLDSKNHGYKAKYNTLYGMEKLPEYYGSGKPVYLVEGIVCCLYLRSKGFQALALLGSSLNTYVVQILRRFGHKLVVIPDNDVIGKVDVSEEGVVSFDNIGERPAGEHFVQQAKRMLKDAVVIQSVIDKDVDDTRKNHPEIEAKFIEELQLVAQCRFLPFTTIRVR